MTLKEKIHQIIDCASESDLLEILSLLERRSQSLNLDLPKCWSDELSNLYGCIQDETFVRQPQPEIGVREELQI